MRTLPRLGTLVLVLGSVACGGAETAIVTTTVAEATSSTTTSTTTTTTTFAPVPGWAAGLFNPEEFDRFKSVVTDFWADSAMTFDFPDGTLTHPELGSLGLMNLAQTVAALDIEEWPDAVASHFNSLLDFAQQADGREEILNDWDQVAPRLRIRLWDQALLEEQAWSDMIVSTPVAPELMGVLIVDFPDIAVSLDLETFETFGVTVPEAFAIAVDNTLGLEAITSQALDVEGCSFDLYGGSFYTASHFLGIEALLSDDNEFGALFAVPVTGDLLVHEVRDQSIHCAAYFMGTVIPELYAEGPNSVSPNFYWYIDGEFYLITMTEVSPGTVRVQFPPHLQGVIDALPPAG